MDHTKPHWLLAFRQSGYALLTARQQPENPCNTISKNSGPVGNYSCRQWGIIIVVDGPDERIDSTAAWRSRTRSLYVEDTKTCSFLRLKSAIYSPPRSSQIIHFTPHILARHLRENKVI